MLKPSYELYEENRVIDIILEWVPFPSPVVEAKMARHPLPTEERVGDKSHTGPFAETQS